MTAKKAAVRKPAAKRKANPKPPKRVIDWAAIEAEWRVGQLSNKEIATRYGVPPGEIGRRRDRHKWVRDLTGLSDWKAHVEMLRMMKLEEERRAGDGPPAAPPRPFADPADPPEELAKRKAEYEVAVGEWKQAVEEHRERVEYGDPNEPDPDPEELPEVMSSAMIPQAPAGAPVEMVPGIQPPVPRIPDDEVVKFAAKRVAVAVSDHVRRINRLKRVTDHTLKQIEKFATARDEEEREAAAAFLFRAKGDSLQTVMRAAAEVSERIQRMERQTLNMDADKGPEAPTKLQIVVTRQFVEPRGRGPVIDADDVVDVTPR